MSVQNLNALTQLLTAGVQQTVL